MYFRSNNYQKNTVYTTLVVFIEYALDRLSDISISPQHQQFSKDELEYIKDALGFTIACLDGEATTNMYEDMKSILRKVEFLPSEKYEPADIAL